MIYKFRSEKPASDSNMKMMFSEFARFMDMCAFDAAAAETLLKNKEVDPQEIMRIMSRYTKEAKRLWIDIKHEREQRVLNVRQRLESELVDSIPGEIDWGTITNLVDLAVPKIDSFSHAIAIGHDSSRNATPVGRECYNSSSYVVDKVKDIVDQEISGVQQVRSEKKQLLELVNKYGNEDASELASSLNELEDPSAPKQGRLNAMQKLKRFVFAIADKLGDAASGVLQSYIENQMDI